MENNTTQTNNFEEEYESPLLDTVRNANISCLIIHEACQTYYSLYKTNWIPISFIEFYFEEYRRFDFLGKNFIEPFFKLYKEIDTFSLIDNYINCHYSLIIDKKNKSSEIHFKITNNDYMQCKMYKPEYLGMFDPALYKELEFISNRLYNSDELISVKDAYEYFMLKRYVLDNDRKVEIKKAQIKAVEEVKKDENSVVLVGAQVNIPKQSGKVTKILFPKLNLPSPYPILLDKSRINSEFKVKKFTRTDQQVKIINKHEFNGVKYKLAFIEKRKAAKKPPKRKFDFDF